MKVPIDLSTVARSGCAAFACATPMRVADLVALAVRQAIGARAPRDHYVRSLRCTLAAIGAGRCRLTVDDRPFERCDDVVVCDGTARVRFYLPSRTLSLF